MPDMSQIHLLLIKHEGLRLFPYKDTKGKLTIGVGRNLDSMGITESEAVCLLDNDIRRVTMEVTRFFPWFAGLNEARRAVIINMAFNLGLTRLRKFKRMIAAIEKPDYVLAAAEMVASAWAFDVGRRAQELAIIMREGKF